MITSNRMGYFLMLIMVAHTAVYGSVNPTKSTIDFPHNKSYINTNQPTIIGTLRDATGKRVMNETVQILIDGSLVGIAVSDPDGIYRLLLDPGLPDGQYQLSIYCVESQAVIESNQFNIDTIAPSVTITYPAQGAVITNSTIIISGTTEALASVMTFLDADTFGNICYADEYGNWSIEYGGLTAENHIITAQATDIAGNQGYVSEVINFTIQA